MSDFDRSATPRVSAHGRERCAEMRISTKVAKWIIRRADVVTCTPSRGRDKPRHVATCREYPDYAVPFYVDLDGVPVVLTVLFNTDVPFERNGATFTPRETA